jgi:hypothetical protein
MPSRAAIARLEMTEIRRIPGAWANQRGGRRPSSSAGPTDPDAGFALLSRT